MPLPFILGAASAAAPSIVDWITGASQDRRNAINRRNTTLDMLMRDVQKDRGANVTESTGFKSSMGILDQAYKRRQRQQKGQAIASGATPEMEMGQMEGLNRAHNTASLQALLGAARRRDLLTEQYRSLLRERAGFDIQDANETLASQSQWTQGITSVLPYILGMNKDEDEEGE